jgi:hypothetical protein
MNFTQEFLKDITNPSGLPMHLCDPDRYTSAHLAANPELASAVAEALPILADMFKPGHIELQLVSDYSGPVLMISICSDLPTEIVDKLYLKWISESRATGLRDRLQRTILSVFGNDLG